MQTQMMWTKRRIQDKECPSIFKCKHRRKGRDYLLINAEEKKKTFFLKHSSCLQIFNSGIFVTRIDRSNHISTKDFYYSYSGNKS